MSIEAHQKFTKPSFLDRKEELSLYFVNYHGLSNNFIMVDNKDSMEPRVTPEQAVKLCNRNYGISADGVIIVMLGSNDTDYTMRIVNSVGSEPEMCSNRVCYFAWFITELEKLHGTQSFTIHTGAGLIVPEIQSNGKIAEAEPHEEQLLVALRYRILELANKFEDFALKLVCRYELERLLKLAQEAVGITCYQSPERATMEVYCPFPNCSVLVSPGECSSSRASSSNQSYIVCFECLECRRRVCTSCGVLWHSSMSCEEYQSFLAEERDAGDVTLLHLAQNNS